MKKPDKGQQQTLHVEYGQAERAADSEPASAAPVNPVRKIGDMKVEVGFLAACFYNRKGMCFYIVSSPEFCGGCPNWRTFDKDFMERVRYRGRPPLGLFEYRRLRKPSR